MATTIITKNGSGAPDPSDLSTGELAIDLTNKRIYTKDSGGTVLELGTNAGSSTFEDLSVTGDLTVDTNTLFVNATDNTVGIGVSSPESSLHVRAAVPAIIIEDSTDSSRSTLIYDGAECSVRVDPTNTAASSIFTVDIDGSEVMRINASGNVGIGEDANLDAALVVRGGNYTVNADDGLLIQSGDSTANHIRAGFKLKSSGSGVYRTVLESASNVGGTLTDGTTLDAINIDVVGNIAIPVGNGDGKGITFNNTTHAAATTLDYYEEGEWTPVLSDAETGGNLATPATARGRYTRIGNVVHCTLELTDIDTTGMTGTNSLRLQGLPFVAKGDIVNRVPVAYWNQVSLGSNGVAIALSLTNSQTYGSFNIVNSTGTVGGLPIQNLTSGSADMATVFTYLTNT